jgi:hypothetical protein
MMSTSYGSISATKLSKAGSTPLAPASLVEVDQYRWRMRSTRPTVIGARQRRLRGDPRPNGPAAPLRAHPLRRVTRGVPQFLLPAAIKCGCQVLQHAPAPSPPIAFLRSATPVLCILLVGAARPHPRHIGLHDAANQPEHGWKRRRAQQTTTARWSPRAWHVLPMAPL